MKINLEFQIRIRDYYNIRMVKKVAAPSCFSRFRILHAQVIAIGLKVAHVAIEDPDGRRCCYL